MPLNTQPLSTTRRIVAIVVLVGILGGSLALAQVVGGWKKKNYKPPPGSPADAAAVYNDGVKIALTTLENFVVRNTDEGQNPDVWSVSTPAGQATMIRIDGRSRGYTWDHQAEILRVELSERSGRTIQVDKHEQVMLGGVEAMGFVGRRPRSGEIHAYACSTIIRGHLFQLAIYRDAKPLGEDEIETFVRICAGAKVSVDGVDIGAPATNRGRL